MTIPSIPRERRFTRFIWGITRQSELIIPTTLFFELTAAAKKIFKSKALAGLKAFVETRRSIQLSEEPQLWFDVLKLTMRKPAAFHESMHARRQLSGPEILTPQLIRPNLYIKSDFSVWHLATSEKHRATRLKENILMLQRLAIASN